MSHFVFLNPDGSADLGLDLIVLAPTGVRYAVQAGGLDAATLSAEGFIIPLGHSEVMEELFSLFRRRRRSGRTDARGAAHARGVSDEEADRLEEIVGRITCWFTDEDGWGDRPAQLRLDASRMESCAESWVPVITPYGAAILTFPNSE